MKSKECKCDMEFPLIDFNILISGLSKHETYTLKIIFSEKLTRSQKLE